VHEIRVQERFRRRPAGLGASSITPATHRGQIVLSDVRTRLVREHTLG
jgi:hypothetical protein